MTLFFANKVTSGEEFHTMNKIPNESFLKFKKTIMCQCILML